MKGTQSYYLEHSSVLSSLFLSLIVLSFSALAVAQDNGSVNSSDLHLDSGSENDSVPASPEDTSLNESQDVEPIVVSDPPIQTGSIVIGEPVHWTQRVQVLNIVGFDIVDFVLNLILPWDAVDILISQVSG